MINPRAQDLGIVKSIPLNPVRLYRSREAWKKINFEGPGILRNRGKPTDRLAQFASQECLFPFFLRRHESNRTMR
ncbi:hypothetical protein FQZ97_751140 [compost metagenome]